jgi:PAS domain S-box-containing protein
MTIWKWLTNLLKSAEVAKIEASLEKTKKDFEENMRKRLKGVEKESQSLKSASSELSKTAIGLTALLEEKLDTVEKRFECLKNSVEDIVIIKTSQKRIITINQYACKIFGIEEKICLGKTIEELMTIYPNLNEILKIFNKNETESLSTNKQVKFNTHLNDLIIEVSITPLSIRGKGERELVIVGHTKTEEEAKATDLILNSLPKPLITLDRDLRVYYINHQAEVEFGLSNNSARGKELSELVQQDFAKKLIKATKKNKEVKVDKRAKVFSTYVDGKPKFHIISFL